MTGMFSRGQKIYINLASSVLQWLCNKKLTMVLWWTKTEYRAVVTETCVAIWLRAILADFQVEQTRQHSYSVTIDWNKVSKSQQCLARSAKPGCCYCPSRIQVSRVTCPCSCVPIVVKNRWRGQVQALGNFGRIDTPNLWSHSQTVNFIVWSDISVHWRSRIE